MLTEQSELFIPTFIARQPIFDTDQNVWGYELLYRHSSSATAAIFSEEESATLAIAACASFQNGGQSATNNIFVNFSAKAIMDKVPLALPPNATIVEIAESTNGISPEVMECLQELKNEGYRLCVDGYSGNDAFNELYNMADILKIDVLNDPHHVLKLVKKASSLQAPLVAKRVEEPQTFSAIKPLDFFLYQGFFFEKPEIIKGKILSANEISRLRLFKLIESDEPDFDKLTETIQADVAISYNLLAYLNSPANGLRQKVTSIRQALVLIGWKQIKNWLRVVILSDLAPKDRTSELPYLAVQRGKFFQLMATNSDNTSNPDTLFLLGLFSLLDTMLSMPMEEVVNNLPLDDALKTTLIGGDNEFSLWLDAAHAFEHAQWETLEKVLKGLKTDPVDAAQFYSQSISWASIFFQNQKVD